MKITFNPNILNYSYNFKNQNSAKSASCLNLKESAVLECLAKINQVNFCGSNIPVPVYAMDYWGKSQRYNSLSDAALACGSDAGAIKRSLRGEGSVLVNGYAFEYAQNIEKKDIDGKAVPEDEKLLALSDKFSKGNNVPLYLIHYSGKLDRFNASKEVREKFGIDKNLYTNGIRVSEGGYLFIIANELDVRNQRGEIELDDFGNPRVNYDKLYKILERYAHSYSMPIYFIDIDKNPTRYNSPKDAHKESGFSRSVISQALMGQRIIKDTYTVVNAFDVEKRDDKCQVVLDENNEPVLEDDKVLVYMERFKLKRGKRTTLRKLDTDEVLHFDSQQEAADELGVTRTAVNKAIHGKGFIKGYLAENG